MGKQYRNRLRQHPGVLLAATRVQQQAPAHTLVIVPYTENEQGERTYHQAPAPPPHECKRPAFCYTCAIAPILCEE
jgi:hypothetical protein